jgi:kinesin family protein 15
MESVEMLEMELIELNNMMEQQKAVSSEQMQHDLYEAIKERDSLHADLVVLNEQLEMAQEMADEQQALAVEARQVCNNYNEVGDSSLQDNKFYL